MEWILGTLLIWFIWKFFTRKARRDTILNEAIFNAYAYHYADIMYTQIYWEAAERFALDRGATVNRWVDGGDSVSFTLQIYDDVMSVSFIRNTRDGTVNIYVEREDELLKTFKQKYGIG